MSKPLLASVFGATLLLTLVLFLSVSRPETQMRQAGDADMGPYLVRMSQTINAGLPSMVDGMTRLDTTIGGPGHEFSYVYTLPSVRSDEISAAGVRSAYAPALMHNFCTLPEMQPLVAEGVAIVYVYRGSDGQEITRVRVSPSDCLTLGVAPVIYSA